MISEEQARQMLVEYMEHTGKTQTDVAKEMGISGPQLSGFLSGTYKTPHRTIPRVEQFFKINEKKEVAPKEPGFQRTTVSGIVLDLIEHCHIQGKVGVAYGDAGIGKTMAIREYVRLNPDSTVYMTISPCFATVNGAMELLAKEMRIREKMARQIYSEAVQRLKGSSKVVIVDEAQHLTLKAIDQLRHLAEDSGVGMTFVGNEEIYLKMRGRQEKAYSQLYSRIANRQEVLTNHITREDIALVFGESGVDGDAVEILFRISRTNYGLRGAVNVFVNAAAVFGEVTAKHISRMAKEMNIV